jgi:Tol biopolymer transport system component
MPLATGTRLGPYEILSPAGAGGMGEVYRARDSRLGRDVAIKVLPRHFSQDPNRRERFEREARVVSALSHPHICTLHDIGEQDGVDFLVLEYLEGETLEHRLVRGPLPTDQVLRYAMEIADALEKAHRQGVVHRDLKPGNIMLTKGGAKLLDFGVAKLAVSSAPLADALTEMTSSEKRPLTEEGSILGTFQYMAPEQLEGREADARTDIFSLGELIYEMTSGRAAFAGKTKASLIASILSSEPPALTQLAPVSPPALERLVRICLAKDPNERFQSAHDLKLQLAWIAEGGSQAGVPAPVSARRRWRERALWAGVGLLALAVAGLGAAYWRSRPVPGAVIRSSILLPENANVMMVGPNSMAPAISPDGRRLAFVAIGRQQRQIWVRSLDGLSAQPLTGTEGASFPFWSSDSRFLGFFADGRLKKIDASGGPAQTLCDAPDARGGSWNSGGVIVFASSTAGGLSRVLASGGVPSPVTELDSARQEISHRWPWFLPDGKHFLFFSRSAVAEQSGILVASLEGSKPKLVVNTSSSVAYAPPGYLLYVRERSLVAQPFDATSLELGSEVFPIAETVQTDGGFAHAMFTVSGNGTLVFQAGGGGPDSQLRWLTREGKEAGNAAEPATSMSPALSPDARRLVVEVIDSNSGNVDLWLYELARGVRTRFTFDAFADLLPIWSPDGAQVAFASNRKGYFGIYLKPADGSGPETELFALPGVDVRPLSFSPDGKHIAYRQLDPKTKTRLDIWILPLSGERKPFPFVQTAFDESWAAFSPDGKWIAYNSDESGLEQVYVAPFPGPGGRWQVSSTGGSRPHWRKDGREIYFLAADDKLMAAEVRAEGASLAVGVVRSLFSIRPKRLLRVYDVTADGRRFLVNTAIQERNAVPLTLVVNWSSGVRP